MIVLIDNYDSFTYNLYQMIAEIEPNIEVVRNDAITIEQIKEMKPEAIILSPGPGYPAQAGICEQVVKEFADECKILGVCLGHQAICEAYGATIEKAKELMHGKQCAVKCHIDKRSKHMLFCGIGDQILAARYHSLVANSETLPQELRSEERRVGKEC